MCSAIAHARLRPSSVLVPRPISSRIDQAAVGRVVEDVGRLGHLDHERRLPGVQLVARADAGEEAVGQADRRALGRHVAADLRQQRDQRDLADVGALAGHVRAGDERERVVRRRSACRWRRTRCRAAGRAPDAGRRRSPARGRRRPSAGSSAAPAPATRATTSTSSRARPCASSWNVATCGSSVWRMFSNSCLLQRDRPVACAAAPRPRTSSAPA